MLRGTEEYVRNAEARLLRARDSGDIAETWLLASKLAVMERRRASLAARPARLKVLARKRELEPVPQAGL